MCISKNQITNLKFSKIHTEFQVETDMRAFPKIVQLIPKIIQIFKFSNGHIGFLLTSLK